MLKRDELDPSFKATQGQPLDPNSLINGASQGQAGAGLVVGGQQGTEGIDASSIINGFANGQQGGNNVANAAAPSQGQGQASADLNALLPAQDQQQSGVTGLDAGTLLNGLTNSQGQEGKAEGAKGGSTSGTAGVADVLGEGSNGINQILEGFSGQNQGQGQGNNGIEIIQVKETIVQQINGAGAAKETIIEGAEGSKTRDASSESTRKTDLNGTVCIWGY